jgi:hypothetical protein
MHNFFFCARFQFAFNFSFGSVAKAPTAATMNPMGSPWFFPYSVYLPPMATAAAAPMQSLPSAAPLPFTGDATAAVSTMTAASVLRKPQELMAVIRATRASNQKHLQNWEPHEAIALIRACRSYQDNLNKFSQVQSVALVFKGAPWDYIATKLVVWPPGSTPRDGKACKDKMHNLKGTWVRPRPIGSKCRVVCTYKSLTRCQSQEETESGPLS